MKKANSPSSIRFDPCDLARSCPSELLKHGLADLNISVRVGKLLREHHINTISDLAKMSSAELLEKDHFGSGSLMNLYLAIENELNRSFLSPDNQLETLPTIKVRKRIGRFSPKTIKQNDRVSHSKKHDPCDLARSCPSWFLEHKLVDLNISVRAENVLRKNHIHTISDLAKMSSAELLEKKNFGKTSLKNVHQAINLALIEETQNKTWQQSNKVINPKEHDPCDLARSCPLWFLEHKLVDLNISVLAENVLRNNHIYTISDLAKMSSAELFEKENFGETSLKNVHRAIKHALKEEAQNKAWKTNNKETVSHTFISEFHYLISKLSSRDRDIICTRFGLNTQQKTLQQIADKIGVTRERVRQIENKATKQLFRNTPLYESLFERVNELLIGRDYPLSVIGIEAIDPWFKDVSSNLESIEYLINKKNDGRLHIIKIDGDVFFSLISESDWNSIISNAKALLSSLVNQDWSESQARSAVNNLLPLTAREFEPILWEKSSRRFYFAKNSTGNKVLTGHRWGAEAYVETALSESARPMHYSEISESIRAMQGKSFQIRRVHQAAAKVGLLFGRGVYGLPKHLPISENEISKICSVVEDLVDSSSAEKQWHTSEILKKLSDSPNKTEIHIDKLDNYVLDITLRQSKHLKSLKRLMWMKNDGTAKGGSRINIHQAVVSIIETAGHPLTTNEIKNRLIELRGTSEYFQIFPSETLVRLKPGLWGIKARDITNA